MRTLILLLLIFLVISCESTSEEGGFDQELEKEIILKLDSLYNQNYSLYMEDSLSFPYSSLFERLEQYFLASGKLQSVNKRHYLEFLTGLANSEIKYDVGCLHRTIAKAHYINSPGNIGSHVINFESLMNEFDSRLPEGKKFRPVAIAIEAMWLSPEPLSEQTELIKAYLKSLDDERFESHYLFRAWLILVAYFEIAYKQ